MRANALLSPKLCSDASVDSPPERAIASKPMCHTTQGLAKSLDADAFDTKMRPLELVANLKNPIFCNSSAPESFACAEQYRIKGASQKVRMARAIANNSSSVLQLAALLTGVGIGCVAYGAWMVARSSRFDTGKLCGADGFAMNVSLIAHCIADSSDALHREVRHAEEALVPLAAAMLVLGVAVGSTLPWAKNVSRKETVHKK